MKIFRNIFMTVLVLGMLVIPSFDSHAAEPDPYTYKITFYSGKQGTFAGGNSKLVHSDLASGSKLFFNAQSAVSLSSDSKYYVKGVRLAGRDNSESEMSTLTVTVDQDADYVVVYGIKGNQVGYTVRYQDADGRKLAENDVFYGNVGDKPVVAYRYIEGYVPKTFGLTKTLSANEADNVFTFVYDETEDGVEYVEGPTSIIYKDTVVTVIRGTSNGGGAGNAGTGTSQNTQESDSTQQAGEETADPNAGQEIVDLDDEETPLGNIDLDDEKAERGLSMMMILSLAAMGILALVVMIILILRMKERMNNHER